MLYYNIGWIRDDPGHPMGAPVGMKWFRSNIKHGSRLALLALALQFGLSFGHFHADIAHAAPAIQSVAQPDSAAALDAVDQLLPAPHHDSDQHPTCALCAILALTSAALSATPPALPLPQAAQFRYLGTDAEFADLDTVDVAFQPRAPPAS